jgi:glutaredoxin
MKILTDEEFVDVVDNAETAMVLVTTNTCTKCKQFFQKYESEIDSFQFDKYELNPKSSEAVRERISTLEIRSAPSIYLKRKDFFKVESFDDPVALHDYLTKS